jgi:molybdopterin-guanine dinucleotide biosynthesis protein A
MPGSTSLTPPLRGLVLAGGQSRRMGADKATLQAGGMSLLDRAVVNLEAVVDEVYVAVKPGQVDEPARRKFSLIEDLFADIGPAAGLLSAHVSYPESAWLVIACDMPLLGEPILNFLCNARDAQRDVTALAVAADQPAEPLCAIYEPGTLAAFLVQVGAGGNSSPSSWLASVRIKKLTTPVEGALLSANTTTELARMIENIESRPSAFDRKP